MRRRSCSMTRMWMLASRMLAAAKYPQCRSGVRVADALPGAGEGLRQFVDGFVGHAKAVKVGDGLDTGTTMGPLANARRIAAMEAFIGDAVQHGATRAAPAATVSATRATSSSRRC